MDCSVIRDPYGIAYAAPAEQPKAKCDSCVVRETPRQAAKLPPDGGDVPCGGDGGMSMHRLSLWLTNIAFAVPVVVFVVYYIYVMLTEEA